MQTLRLLKLAESDQGTISALFDGFRLLCYMLELPERDNRRGLSRIPRSGEYLCRYMARSASGKYRNCWHVVDVPGRSGILIHPGNFAGDTTKGYKTHSLGCLLPASRVGKIDGQLAGLASRMALDKINNLLNEQSFLLRT